MTDQNEPDLLLQKDWREQVIPMLGQIPNDTWIPIYQDSDDGTVDLAINSVLIPNENVGQLLQTHEWGGHVFELKPGFSGGSEDSPPVYRRLVGSEYGIEPLVILRSFHGIKPDSIEILEEFRLYHNLYEDRQNSKLIGFDAGGNEVDVVRFSNDLIQVSRRELRQFLAARDMSLAVFFDRRYHAGRLVELSEQERKLHKKRDDYVYRFDAFDHRRIRNNTQETYSRLLGKRVIAGLPRDKCGIWPYDDEPISELEKFIIGIDDNEDDILAYSSPYSYGAATTALELPSDYEVYDYLTPVFFDRRVLNKYRDEPTNYAIRDGSLSCGNTLWRMDIDNNNPNYIIVWLGDLGRDLPYTEHKHWRQHNVVPDGRMSDSHLRAQLPATLEDALDPGEPEDSALRFIRAYRTLSTAWTSKFNWHIFKPLRDADYSVLKTIHVPVSQESDEFDREMLKLSKLLCDSINVKKLKEEIKTVRPGYSSKDADGTEKKSIQILEDFLTSRNFDDCARFIGQLRMIQALRSTGAAHRKGTNYTKAEKAAGLDTKTVKQVAEEIFTTFTSCFQGLREHFCPEEED